MFFKVDLPRFGAIVVVLRVVVVGFAVVVVDIFWSSFGISHRVWMVCCLEISTVKARFSGKIGHQIFVR